jgi:hypothetical protein
VARQAAGEAGFPVPASCSACLPACLPAEFTTSQPLLPSPRAPSHQALSQGELTSALYNIACCRSQLGDIENGLTALAGAVEQGALGCLLAAAACGSLHRCPPTTCLLSFLPQSSKSFYLPSKHAGYRDFPQMRADPDLAALRADERFEGLLKRFTRQEPAQGKGFLGLF